MPCIDTLDKKYTIKVTKSGVSWSQKTKKRKSANERTNISIRAERRRQNCFRRIAEEKKRKSKDSSPRPTATSRPAESAAAGEAQG